MSTVYLKVKIKSLAAEAKIIKHEEQRSKGTTRSSLASHRKNIVRRESRNSHLAYGYLRGRTYKQLEKTCHSSPDWDRVERMIKKYGPPRHNTSFEDWRKHGMGSVGK